MSLIFFVFLPHAPPDNASSKKVLEKAGMQWEGTLRENLRMKNGWRDSMVYGILKHGWQSKRKLATKAD